MKLLRALLVAFVFITGCGGPPRNALAKLTVLGLSLDAGSHLRQDAIDAYAQKAGIEVDLIPTPGTSTEQLAHDRKLLSRHASTPDVYLIDIVWPGTLHQDLLDLTPYLNEESRMHVPALIQNNTIHGRLVSLPFYMNTGMLYYRADLLKKYGYSAPPATWDELARDAARIQSGERQQGNRNFWGYVWQGAAYEGLTCNAMEWQASFGGGHIIENNGVISVDNPAAVRAMNTAASWVGSISPSSVLFYNESDTVNAFTSGNAAFIRHWSSAFLTIRDGMRQGSVGVAPMPEGPAGRAYTLGGFEFAVSRYSPHPREAAALVLYLTSPEVERRRALLRGYVPSYPHLYSQPELLRALPQIGVLQNADPKSWVARPSAVTGASYAEVSKAYYESVHEILSGKVRARKALPELARKLEELTGLRQGPPGIKHDL